MPEEVTLPAQLQKQLEEVKKQAASDLDDRPTEEPEAPVQAETPVQEVEDIKDEVIPVEEVESQSQAMEPEVQHEEPKREDDSWRERYLSIKGKYDAEVPRLNAEAKRLKAELAEVRVELEEAKSAPKIDQSTNFEITDEFIEQNVDEDQIEEFGLEHWRTLLRLQMLTAQKAAPQSQVQDDSRMVELEEQLLRQREEAFFKDLANFVPDWKEINRDQKFIQFLENVDQVTGRTYQSLLDEARRDQDAHRVASIFDLHKERSVKKDVLSSPKAKQIMPSPQGSSPSGETKISFAEWDQRLKDVVKSGKEPREMAAEQAKLMAMYQNGQVSTDEKQQAYFV